MSKTHFPFYITKLNNNSINSHNSHPTMFSPTQLTLTITLLFLSLTSPSSSSTSPSHIPTAYEVLESYDFPVGILPKGVTGYELNTQTGEFKVFIGKTCKFSIDSYQLEYKSTITGVISKDRLTNLKGVSVKVFLLWLNIVEVRKEGDDLAFSVGIASANFPTDGFDESPSCGCGFDCVGRGANGGGLVSSS